MRRIGWGNYAGFVNPLVHLPHDFVHFLQKPAKKERASCRIRTSCSPKVVRRLRTIGTDTQLVEVKEAAWKLPESIGETLSGLHEPHGRHPHPRPLRAPRLHTVDGLQRKTPSQRAPFRLRHHHASLQTRQPFEGAEVVAAVIPALEARPEARLHHGPRPRGRKLHPHGRRRQATDALRGRPHVRKPHAARLGHRARLRGVRHGPRRRRPQDDGRAQPRHDALRLRRHGGRGDSRQDGRARRGRGTPCPDARRTSRGGRLSAAVLSKAQHRPHGQRNG